ncbi:RNA 2',3'-cyclic phosphodiesterase [Brevibacillus fulvus]|uniref:RNA 2',3'-cyclic phosphodiesterase n=1 Tax=Brevibacillus fulvus TaxID=1125967 RepID=A0A939BVQ8_9BACL|nr:2'-5' RNA ligase [Brevibacillus fulvus]
MRLFVALDIPESAVAFIAGIQQQVKQEIRAQRWQPLHNLHLTLHFLGEVDETLLPELIHDLDLVSAIIKPFSLQVGHLGAFPHAERPRVLWIGLRGYLRALEQLHTLLGKRFELHQEVSFDRRTYQPHITLARGPRTDGEKLPLAEWNQRLLGEATLPHWEVRQVHLFQSELRPEGAVHTILHSATLSGEDK